MFASTAAASTSRPDQVDQGAEAMQRWYTEVGTKWLRKRIRPWAARMGEESVTVEVRDLGFRWGSARPQPGPSTHQHPLGHPPAPPNPHRLRPSPRTSPPPRTQPHPQILVHSRPPHAWLRDPEDHPRDRGQEHLARLRSEGRSAIAGHLTVISQRHVFQRRCSVRPEVQTPSTPIKRYSRPWNSRLTRVKKRPSLMVRFKRISQTAPTVHPRRRAVQRTETFDVLTFFASRRTEHATSGGS